MTLQDTPVHTANQVAIAFISAAPAAGPAATRDSSIVATGHKGGRSGRLAFEGYPDLVVHGPLIATLLLDSVARSVPGAVVREHAYKAVRPSFLGNRFTVCGRRSGRGKTVQLWAADRDGWLTMSAHAMLA